MGAAFFAGREDIIAGQKKAAEGGSEDDAKTWAENLPPPLFRLAETLADFYEANAVQFLRTPFGTQEPVRRARKPSLRSGAAFL